MNEVWEDLKFFLGRLRSLPVSESIMLGNSGGFCVSTGCEFENWVYFPEPVNDTETVRMADEFFRERGETFMWPVYDGGNEILERSGLLHAGKLEAMSLDPLRARTGSVNPAVTFRAVTSHSLAEEWARCEWSAFEYGDGEPSGEYFDLAGAFFDDRENLSMNIATLDGHDVGAFLTTKETGLMGVYYFATVPEFRRKGVAASMMNEICRLSCGKKIVLQSTPSGVPFYEAFGFSDLGAIEVYSTVGDIF